MKKIAYFPTLADDPASWYRMSGVLDYIDHPELSFKNIIKETIFNWSVFSGCSALILQRPLTQAHVAMIHLAKDQGLRIISDWDDDLFNVPVHRNPTISLPEMKKNIKMTLHLSDEVWVSTPALKKLYKPFNRNIFIIPNAHNDIVYPVSGKMSFKKGKLLTYRGGASHLDDVQQNLNDVVKTMSLNKDWEFRFVGSGKPTTDNPNEYRTQFELLDNRTHGFKNHTFTLPSSLLQFFKVYNEFNAQLAYFPLVTNEFNAGKSCISLMEATYAGSCYLGNKELPEFNHDFVVDISKGLYEPFEEIKNDCPRMKRLNYRAWEWMIEERLLSNVNKLRIERLCS